MAHNIMFDKMVAVGEKTVTTSYGKKDPNDLHAWGRIKRAALFLETASLGPHVVSINDASWTIVTEKVGVFPPKNRQLCPPELCGKEVRREIVAAVERLHRAGWIHGDLSYDNIGYRVCGSAFEIVFLDYDTVHKVVDQSFPEWFRVYREDYCGTEGETYESILAEEKSVACLDCSVFLEA